MPSKLNSKIWDEWTNLVISSQRLVIHLYETFFYIMSVRVNEKSFISKFVVSVTFLRDDNLLMWEEILVPQTSGKLILRRTYKGTLPMPVLQVISNLSSICFNLGQIDFFATNKTIFFRTFSLVVILFSSLYLHSTYLTYYSPPALPTSQTIFFLSQCLPCEPWTRDLLFSFGFMSWYLTSEPWRLGYKFHNVFVIIYTL